jgi:hypothetical protein
MEQDGTLARGAVRPANRKSELAFPTLDCADALPHVSGDVLPRRKYFGFFREGHSPLFLAIRDYNP